MPSARQVLGLAASTTTNVTDLIPADIYSAKVLEALYAARVFAGIITAVREDLTAGPGSIIQVPYMTRRTAQGPISEGNALTATAVTHSTYPITLAKYGDYDLVNREVFEDQDIFNQDDYVRNMAAGLAEKVDALIYATLIAATAGTTKTVAVAGTITDLYTKLVDCMAGMRKLNEEPTIIIMGPDQEAALLKDTTNNSITTQNIGVTNGRLLSVAGVPCIITSLANSNTTAASRVQAVVLNTNRAMGEAWGRRPDTTVDDVSKAESDQVKLVTWIRYGNAAMDLNAIGLVTNP